jgi:hypothetical protein
MTTPEVDRVPDSWDDEQLLGALNEALQARRAVSPEFIEAGKNAYAWHNIDAELAQLTYDSQLDRDGTLSVRSETASIRTLTFTTAHLAIELEISEDHLLVQVIPPDEATIEIHTRAGPVSVVAVDEFGCHTVHPIPPSPFRLNCRTAKGLQVSTSWLTV